MPRELREMYRLGVTLKYCKKPLYGIVDGGKETVEKSLDIMEKFYGFKDKVYSTGLIATMGAMQMSTDMCEAVIAYSKRKQALILTSGVVIGANAPQSMAGSFILGNAMVIAGIVLSQLVNPGTPVIYCGKFASSDIRYLAPAYGGVESMTGCATSRRMASYYNVPLQSGCSNTESKVMDYQTGAETFMNLFSAYMLDVDCLLHACGLLDSMNSLGYEKYILDEEMNASLKHLHKGYEINEKTVMFDLMKKKGPTGQYLGRTLRTFYEDYFIPKFAIRDNHNNWIASGMPTAESLATLEWKKRLEEYTLPEMTNEQSKIIKELIPPQYQ